MVPQEKNPSVGTLSLIAVDIDWNFLNNKSTLESSLYSILKEGKGAIFQLQLGSNV